MPTVTAPAVTTAPAAAQQPQQAPEEPDEGTYMANPMG